MKRYIKRTYLVLILICILSMSFSVCMGESNEELQDEEKIVYLTFDDGPTQKITEHLLDVLKEYNVKATFFIVGKEIIQCEDILKRIYNEGHTLGLHTYSHNIKKIYKNKESFIEEMKEVEAAICDVIGFPLDSRVIRFPGGSSSRLNEEWLQALHEEGYKIFDWNVCIDDGIRPDLSPIQLIEKSKKCSRNTTKRIILAHCNLNNQNTCLALPGIIEYYQSQGYVFKRLDNQTEEFFFPIKGK